MTERVAPKRHIALTDAIDDGGPHTAGADIELAAGTEALVRHAAANRMTLCWHSPQWDTTSYQIIHAPYADITDATTWTSFVVGDSNLPFAAAPFDIPWYVSDAHSYPSLRVSFVCDARYLSFEARIQKSTWVTSTSTETFEAPKSYMPFYAEGMSEWATAYWDKGYPSSFVPQIECVGMSVPAAPRDVLLTPQVKISQRGTSALADVAGQVRVYISQMMVYDDWTE